MKLYSIYTKDIPVHFQIPSDIAKKDVNTLKFISYDYKYPFIAEISVEINGQIISSITLFVYKRISSCLYVIALDDQKCCYGLIHEDIISIITSIDDKIFGYVERFNQAKAKNHDELFPSLIEDLQNHCILIDKIISEAGNKCSLSDIKRTTIC